MSDLSKIIAAVAKMRRPRIMLNPSDFARLRTALVAVLAGHGWFASAGIEIASGDEVPVGQMRVVEMAETPLGAVVPFESERP